MGDFALDLTTPPPEGVFYNRMSASSHTRGHRYAPEMTTGLLHWLEASGRRVLNGSRAVALEINKLRSMRRWRVPAWRSPTRSPAIPPNRSWPRMRVSATGR